MKGWPDGYFRLTGVGDDLVADLHLADGDELFLLGGPEEVIVGNAKRLRVL